MATRRASSWTTTASVSPADHERVFERFTRLDDSRARPQGGSGLGLAVVRAIVSRHNGQICVEDSPLGGARFVVELPREANDVGVPPEGQVGRFP